MKLLLGSFPYDSDPSESQVFTSVEEFQSVIMPQTDPLSVKDVYEGVAISIFDQIPTDQRLTVSAQLVDCVKPGYKIDIWDPEDPDAAFRMLRRFNLRDYRQVEHGGSVVVCATKPQLHTPRKITVVMSTPRHGAVIAQTAAYSALMGLGSTHFVDLCVNQGVWWHHGMSRTIEQALETPVDYILTLDFDTMCTAADLNFLIETAELRSDLDALFALQMRRSRLGALLGGEEINLRESVVLAERGHFGATILSPQALRRMPKPWFKESPDEHGSWNDDRTDADMGFWDNILSQGGRIGCLLDVGVGHLEEMIAMPVVLRDRIETQHLTPSEWAMAVHGQPGKGNQ